MIREYPNGDKAEIKGLTVTVELGEESIGRIRKAALDEIDSLKAENAKLRELVDGLTWCCEHYSCRQECPLYDVSEPDHCREVSIKRELRIEVDW